MKKYKTRNDKLSRKKFSSEGAPELALQKCQLPVCFIITQFKYIHS